MINFLNIYFQLVIDLFTKKRKFDECNNNEFILLNISYRRNFRSKAYIITI